MAQQQQYGYGYGYQAYGYAQPAAGYVGYAATARPTAYAPAPHVAPPPPAQQQSVGYSPYIANAAPTNQPQGTGGVAAYGQASQQAAATPVPQPVMPAQSSYNSYPSYKPQTPAYTPYYNKTVAASASSATRTGTVTTSATYVPTYSGTPPSSVASNAPVGYPSYSQSSYASSANAYYKQTKDNKQHMVGYPTQSSSYTPASYTGTSYTATSTQQNLTPVQQQVVQQYIHQKNQGGPQNYAKTKRVFTPPQNPHTYYCEVCRISCASALTQKTHLEGKIHRKKLAQQELLAKQDKSKCAFYCEVCDIVCSNKDGLDAHMRGSKHQKVINLHKKLGKPLPTPVTSTSDPSGPDKTVMVTAPRISFVGGKQLNTTGSGYKEADVKVYPTPSASTAAPTVGTAKASFAAKPSTSAKPNVAANSATITTPTTPGVAAKASIPTTPSATTTPTATATPSAKATPTTPVSAAAASDHEPQPVGENLVIGVRGDPKFPHALFKCTMCDCYFNDDYACKAHVKGRRHRLNYKKTYDSTLYVEPTKSMKKEIEKKRQHREMVKKQLGQYARAAGGRYWSAGGAMMMDANQARRNELLEKARVDKMMQMQRSTSIGFDDYYPRDPLLPPPSFQPINPHDDKLVLNKHSVIYPNDAELRAVDDVVADVEKVLKVVSDDMLTEKCQLSEAPKDESKRVLKGVMRVGAFARGLLLKGECNVELILMTATKPTKKLFSILATSVPAKFDELKNSGAIKNVYNVTPEEGKAAFLVISQVGNYCIQVSLTLTSTTMRDEPTAQQAKIDEQEGVLDRPSCLAALAALRHTKWFQAMAHNLPACIITMRVLKDICRRVPAWGVLDTWVLQLLVQKCIVSANTDFTKPGDVFRRVVECVASGLFLPGGVGLFDPCEKGSVDAAASLSAQERANITLSAQHALRLIAFGKLHLVLGVDPLTVPGDEEEGGASVGTKRDAEALDEEEDHKKIKLDS